MAGAFKVLPSCILLLAVVVSRCAVLASPTQNASPDEGLIAKCALNLWRIHEAAEAYKRRFGDFPRRLSDLAGEWLAPETLVCPFCQAGHTAQLAQTELINWTADEDPLTTYKWEFHPSSDPTLANGQVARNSARKTPIGDWAALARCDHHLRGRRDDHLNLGFNGQVYWSSYVWEEAFVDLFPATYLNPNMLEKDVRPIKDRLPPRARANAPAQIDLTSHWNALLEDPWFDGRGEDTLGSFEKLGVNGTFTLAGRRFDVRGIIQLDGLVDQMETQPNAKAIPPFLQGEAILALPYSQFPTSVRGIKVGQAARQVAFLCGGIYPSPSGTEIARFEMHYSDRSSLAVPLVYGIDCVDGWYDAKAEELRKFCQAECVHQAPKGSKTYRYHDNLVRRVGGAFVFLKLWKNPRPETPLDHLDFVSSATGNAPAPTCPFLLAITLE